MPLAHKDPRLPAVVPLPPGDAWTTAIPTLTSAQAQTLVSVVRTLCPHDMLSLDVYRRAAVE
nr:hypothetical protein [Burkholderiales bacterium]